MTCEAQHEPITFDGEACPLCEYIALAHRLKDQLIEVTGKVIAAQTLARQIIDRHAAFLDNLEATLAHNAKTT
jgi:hypothetical protein